MAARRRSIVELEEQLAHRVGQLTEEMNKLDAEQSFEVRLLESKHLAMRARLEGKLEQAKEALEAARLDEQPTIADA